MSLKALIFDADGTLADTEEVHRQAFNAAFLEHGLPWSWDLRRYAGLVAISGGKERIRSYIDSLGEPAPEKARLQDQVPAVHRAKTRLYAGLIAGGKARLRPGVTRLMQEAREAGIRLAIASGTTPANVEALIAATLGGEARHWFDAIACGDRAPNPKPAPDVYHLALAMLLATLYASASYIAAPAAMRIAVPEANPALSIGASLGITFPFNLLVGIPVYHWVATKIHAIGG